jgi:inactivated superfamily I helicase
VDFLATLAGQIIDGGLVPGLAYNPEDPLSLAGATVFVPTRRAARVLALRAHRSHRQGIGDPAVDPSSGRNR